jgi:serine/threonine-protein kinase
VVTAAPDIVKVLDFGIAKSDDVDDNPRVGKRLTRPGVAMGTPEYMAPEQAAGHPADPRSDIYAAGSILYEMLTGVPPYDGDNVMEILHKKANEPPAPISGLRSDVPASVVALVDRSMARNPADRPQSMAEFGREIREVEAVLALAPAPVVLALPAVPEARIDDSLPNQESVAFPGRLRSLVASWKWAVLAAAAAAALTAVLLVRGHSRVRVLASVDAGRVDSGILVVAAPPDTRPVSLDGAADLATDTQILTDTQEPDQEAEPAESAPAEETHKREASPRPRVARTPPIAAVPLADGRKLLQEGRDFLRAQRFDEARAAFERLVHSPKTRGPALVGLAKIAFQKHEYQEAVNQAREGARAGGGAEARVVLGDAYFRLEKIAESRKAYEEALKLDPDNRTARQNLDLLQRRGY